jgi:hypothetical protein
MSAHICESCEPHGLGLERVRYYPRQLVTADDMTAEQYYFRQKLRRHNRYLHGWGVVCGLEVKPMVEEGLPWQVRVCPGYAAGPQGDEILVSSPVDFDLATGAQKPADPCADLWPCPPTGRMPVPGRQACVHLAIRYTECDARPQRVHPAGCGCDETSCEYSRIRDAFELKLLWELPKSHKDAQAWDDAWTAQVKTWKAGAPPANTGAGLRLDRPMPVPPCMGCPTDPWVVIACIHLPAKSTDPITEAAITYKDRRVLYSVHALRLFLEA